MRHRATSAKSGIVAAFVAVLVFGGNPESLHAGQTIVERLKKDVAAAPLAMRFNGASADECRAWQQEFGDKLGTLLGPHTPPAQWKTLVRITVLPDHVRFELQLSAEGHPPLPMYLLMPDTKKNKYPAILAIHGHGGYGHHPVAGRNDIPGAENAIKSANYDYGRQLVRQGYIVAVPCLTPFGDRLGKWNSKQDPCADTFLRMQIMGKTLIGENLRDCLWAIEYLSRHESVDKDRIGCVGLSYGGRMTMLTSALEPRIKVCVISGAMNVMQERVSRPYSCGAQIIPGLLQYGDVPEIASLIAPRPCLWEVGTKDSLIDATWVDEILLRQRRAYKALGAEDKVSVERFDGGHRWNGVDAAKLLAKTLKP